MEPSSQRHELLNEEFLKLMPKFEQLSDEYNVNENNLYEIKNKDVIDKINSILPQIFNVFNRKVDQAPIQNIDDFLQSNHLYKVIIPDNAKLFKAKDLSNAFRGGYHINNKLVGQAHLVKVNLNDLKQIPPVSVESALLMALIVVHQYYMEEIDTKLGEISVKLEKIAEFQQLEFKARIMALLNKVGKLTNFVFEIIDNDEVRKRSLESLNRYEDEGTELLQQVNLSIDNVISKHQNIDYVNYEIQINELEKLTHYQQYLILVLEEVGRLNYLFNHGKLTSKMCYSAFETYIVQSNKTRKGLSEWHKKQMQYLEIRLDEQRRAKQGIEGILGGIQGMINNDWKYYEVSTSLITKIKHQSTVDLKIEDKTKNLLHTDKEIIIQNGKYYYLTE